MERERTRLRREGVFERIHLIRAHDDPDDEGDRWRALNRFPQFEIDQTPARCWAFRIERLLEDGTPRTFNRIAMELFGTTSDGAFDTTLDAALWWLVDEEIISHTYAAPITFTLAKQRAARRAS